MAKIKRLSLTSPVGRAVFPHLNTPDTMWDKEGAYKVDLNPSDPEEAKALLSKLEELHKMAIEGVAATEDTPGLDPRSKTAWDGAVAKGTEIDIQALPVKEQDEEFGGGLLFSFKMKAKGRTRGGETFDRAPRLFDATGNPCDEFIGTGSIIRVSFEANLYYTPTIGAGVSLRLQAVQIIKLGGAGRSAEDFGFDAVDGFSIEDADNFDAAEGETADGYDFG